MMGDVDTTGLERTIEARAVELANLLADAFVEGAQSRASRRTGEMADSVTHNDPQVNGGYVTVTVTCTAPQGRYLNDGTGIYGPEGTPIVALHTLPNGQPGFLHFDSPIVGEVFTRSVRGVPPDHWWDRTIDDWPNIVSSVAG